MISMPPSIKIKNIVYKYYWILAIAIVILLLIWVLISKPDVDITIVVSVLTLVFSFTFFIQKQRLEEIKLFTDLFREFNERYSNLNDDLNRIVTKKSADKLPDGDKNILFDYFNLCAEELFYFKRGFIPVEVWESWVNGMKEYYKNILIRSIWDNELKQGSYYGFDTNILSSSLK